MFWLLVILVSLVGLILWLKQTTAKEKTIDTMTSVGMNDLLEFLCSPVNLEKYHPLIQKVTDVKETKEFINFRIEENMGMAGKQTFPMVLKKYRDSQFTAKLRLENNSKYAQVFLTFHITENTPNETTVESVRTSRIKLIIHVDAPRFFNFFIASHLVDVWTTALDKTKSILEQS